MPVCMYSFHLRVWRVSTHTGRGAALLRSMSRALHGLVRGRTAGGLHYRIWLGQGKTYTGKVYTSVNSARVLTMYSSV